MRTRSRVGLVAVLALLASLLAATPAVAAPTATAPGRLYTLVDVPILFDGGDDLISGDTRSLILTADDTGCAPAPNDPPAEGWTVTGCPGLTLSVSNGTLSMPFDDSINDDPLDPLGTLTGGALLMTATNADGTGAVLHINGRTTEINDALETLVYTPDAGYEYVGNNPETLTLSMADNDGPTQQYIDIRVRSVNDFPTITAPATTFTVPGGVGGQFVSPAVAPPVGTPGDWTVEDPDVDDPVTYDLGLGNEMLFVAFSTCGAFSLRGGSFTAVGELEAILGNYFDSMGISDSVERDALVAALIAALPPEVASLTLSSSNPADELDAFIAIGERDEIEYALSQVTYRSGGEQDASCELYSVVSDLGHNGMPARYVGSPSGANNPSPESPVPGFEIPAFGVAFDSVPFDIEAAPELSLPTTLPVSEGLSIDIPLSISDATHPALSIDLITTDIDTDAADYDPIVTPVAFPLDDPGPINTPFQSLEDLIIEGDETLTVEIDVSSVPDGIAIGNAIVTITIENDDFPPDVQAPTVTVEQGSLQVDPTSTSPIVFDVLFSESVTGLTEADFSTLGSSVGGTLALVLSGTGDTYSVSISGMTTAGDVVLSLPAGAAEDAALNDSEASTSVDNTVAWAPPPPDTTAPTVTVEQGGSQVDPTSTSPIVFDIVFSEPVTGLTEGEFLTTGTTAGGVLTRTLTGGPVSYQLEIGGMTTAGDVVLSLPAAVAQDEALNDSEASTSIDNTVAWTPPPPDTTAPTVTVDQAIAQADPTSTSPIVFDVTFSEAVTGLDATDFVTTGSTVGGALSIVVAGGPIAYTASVSGMTTAGDVVLSLPAAAAEDAALNDSEASTSIDNTVAWTPPPPDTTAPTVTVDQAIAQADPTSTSPIVFDVTFSEAVTGLDATDFVTTGSTVGGVLSIVVAGGPIAYTASVSGMTTAGDVVLSLPAAAAEDAALNDSEASTSTDNTVAWAPAPDTTSPTVSIDQAPGQADPEIGATISFVVTFSEPVLGFDASDLDLSASTVGTIVGTVSGAGPAYTVDVTGMDASGDVVLAIAAGAADDAAGNPSLAATVVDNTVTWLTLAPPTDPPTTPPTQLAATGVTPTDPLAFALFMLALGGLILVRRRTVGRTSAG